MHRASNHGFTLVEVLAASVILTVWAVVLSLSVRQSMRSLQAADRTTVVADLIDEVLTKIDTIGPAAVYADGPTAGRFDDPDGDYSWRAEIAPLTNGDLYDVTVTVWWLDAAGTVREVDAQTLLNDPTGSRPAGIRWESL